MNSIFAMISLVLANFVSAGTAFAHDQHGPNHTHLLFQNGALHAHATWTTGPLNGEESVLRLDFKDGATHQSIEPNASVKVVLWMPDMGHGSSPTQTQRILDANSNVITGAFEVNNIYFIMGGKWDVRVILSYPNGQSETQTFSVDLEGGHGGHHH